MFDVKNADIEIQKKMRAGGGDCAEQENQR
jgi:hypothetical protein